MRTSLEAIEHSGWGMTDALRRGMSAGKIAVV
jgi:hypothetical protein